MDLNNESSVHQMDKMAMPNYSGKPFSRPEWEPAPKHRRATKSVSHTRHTTTKSAAAEIEKSAGADANVNGGSNRSRTARFAHNVDAPSNAVASTEIQYKAELKETSVPKATKVDTNSHHSPTDPKFDLSRITTHHAEGSAQVKKDRAEILPDDRKEKARRRLEERKRLRKNAPV
jgi:hypothetical protein